MTLALGTIRSSSSSRRNRAGRRFALFGSFIAESSQVGITDLARSTAGERPCAGYNQAAEWAPCLPRGIRYRRLFLPCSPPGHRKGVHSGRPFLQTAKGTPGTRSTARRDRLQGVADDREGNVEAGDSLLQSRSLRLEPCQRVGFQVVGVMRARWQARVKQEVRIDGIFRAAFRFPRTTWGPGSCW